MAKLHVRHLVGGHAPAKAGEMVYRFEFPERPGALMNFLKRMGSGWNISLFHYRNHGADVGRVLVGLQVPDKDRAAFRRFLEEPADASPELVAVVSRRVAVLAGEGL